MKPCGLFKSYSTFLRWTSIFGDHVSTVSLNWACGPSTPLAPSRCEGSSVSLPPMALPSPIEAICIYPQLLQGPEWTFWPQRSLPFFPHKTTNEIFFFCIKMSLLVLWVCGAEQSLRRRGENKAELCPQYWISMEGDVPERTLSNTGAHLYIVFYCNLWSYQFHCKYNVCFRHLIFTDIWF